MDAAQALADLTEISSQLVQVAILDGSGAVLATSITDEPRAERFASGVGKLLAEAEAAGRARGLTSLGQLEAATLGGSVFLVRRGERTIAATTLPDPTVGLVFYDLKHCLCSIEENGVPAGTPDPPAGDTGKPEGQVARRPRAARKKADAST